MAGRQKRLLCDLEELMFKQIRIRRFEDTRGSLTALAAGFRICDGRHVEVACRTNSMHRATLDLLKNTQSALSSAPRPDLAARPRATRHQPLNCRSSDFRQEQVGFCWSGKALTSGNS